MYRRKIIAVGANLAKSDPWQHRFSSAPDRIYLHAEIAAIKKAHGLIGRHELSKCHLFVCRLKQTNTDRGRIRQFQWALSKPCLGCSRAIESFGIRRVYYTIDVGTYGTWDPWSPYDTHTIDPHVAAQMTRIVATL